MRRPEGVRFTEGRISGKHEPGWPEGWYDTGLYGQEQTGEKRENVDRVKVELKVEVGR